MSFINVFRAVLGGLLLSVIACGRVTDNAPAADAGPSTPADARGDNDAPLSGFYLVAANPANGAAGVSVWTPLRLQFSMPVGPDLGSIELHHGSLLIETNIDYGDSDTELIVTPRLALWYGKHYELKLDGLTSNDGDELTLTIEFDTYINPRSSDIRYGAGAVTKWTSYLYENGAESRRVTYNSTGADETWFTGDDTPYDYQLYSYEANETRYAVHNSAGADGTWFTADDNVRLSIRRKTNAAGQTVETITATPGADAMPYTADDEQRSRSVYEYDAQGRNVRYTYRGADDAPTRYSVSVWNGYQVTERRNYNSPGPDAVWFTTDDSLSSRTVQSFDGDRRVRAVTYDNNDAITSYIDDRDDGDILRQVIYNGAGADAQWFTADDAVSSYLEQKLDGHGSVVRDVRFGGPGADGMWLTADDVPTSYTATTYADNGNRNTRITYVGPGPDGVWFTGDDAVDKRETFLTDF